MKNKSIAIEVISLLIILLFIYTASSKLFNIDLTLHQMYNQPLPKTWAPYLAYLIPSVEILVAILIVIPRTKLLGLIGSSILMTLFTGYVALVLANYYGRTPCSCGGIMKSLNWQQHLAVNSFFLLISILGVILLKKDRNPDKRFRKTHAIGSI